MFSVLILDNDTLRFLEKLISGNPMVIRTLTVSNGKEAIMAAENTKIDVAFLNIELDRNDSYNGITVAKSLRAIVPKLIIIFVSAYTHYALDSFSAHPYDYIVKPINNDKVTNVLTEIANNQAISVPFKNNKMVLKIGYNIVYLDFNKIIVIEKIGKKAFIHTQNEIITCNYGLWELQLLLPNNFVKTHKSYIVNINKVKCIEHLGNTSFIIYFNEYEKNAYLSRYEYENKKHLFMNN